VRVETHDGAAYQPQAEMVYNGLGQRVSLIAWTAVLSLTTHYVLDPLYEARPLAATAAGQTTFYVHGHGPLAELTGEWTYYLTDGNRTVRQLSDADGSITLARSYTPWGELLEQHGGGDLTWGYFGGLLDAATGLIYVGGGQYYDPETGRFLSPIGGGRNPYVPASPGDPLGAMMGAVALVALLARRRRKDERDGWLLGLVLVLVVGVSVGLTACGPVTPTPTPPPEEETPQPPSIPSKPSPEPTKPKPKPTSTKTSPVATPTCESVPTPTMQEWADRARITKEEIQAAGSMENYLRSEDDATLLTRLAMGESRQSAEDRKYVIWIVKLRTHIAFSVNVWTPGQTTTVQQEVFAPNQFAAISAILGVTDPRNLALIEGSDFACGSALNGMIYPCDVSGLEGVAPDPDDLNAEALLEWRQTHNDAQGILGAPITQMPGKDDLRGYDSFLAYDSDGGKQFFANGNYYYDRTTRDNEHVWATPTPAP